MSLLAFDPQYLPHEIDSGQERQHTMADAAIPAKTPDETGDALSKFGARVREFRKARGLTQHQLAESAGIDRKTINRIENTRYSPTLTNVFAIADALEVPANKLL
jgi:DNA-binding XRE family transcriptional regulator